MKIVFFFFFTSVSGIKILLSKHCLRVCVYDVNYTFNGSPACLFLPIRYTTTFISICAKFIQCNVNSICGIFPGMYSWAQTRINTRRDATSVAEKDVRLNFVRSLHWRLMYQFLNSLPQLMPVYTHAHTHTHICTLAHNHTGCSVLHEVCDSRGTRRVPSWKPVAIVTIMELISRGPASFTQLYSLNTHT